MDANSLFDGSDLTQNAREVLHEYLQSARRVARDQKLPEENFLQYAAGQVHNRLMLCEKNREAQGEKDRQTNAEEMLDVLKDSGTPEELAQTYRSLARDVKISPPLYRQLKLSSKNRVVGGVCGGIAEYFQIDALLVRIAFIACCFAAGMTFWLYPILWLVLHENDRKAGITHRYPPLTALILNVLRLALSLLRLVKAIVWPLLSLLISRREPEARSDSSLAQDTPASPLSKSQPAEAVPPESEAEGTVETTNAPARRSWLGKVFAVLAFIVMGVYFYLPATALLLGGAAFCLWGIFYPIVQVDGFRFSFAALDTPGVVLAIFARGERA